MTHHKPSRTGRLAVLTTDHASSWFLLQTLAPYADSRGLQLVNTSPAAANNPAFLHNKHSPLALVIIPGARSSTVFRETLGTRGFENLRDYVRRGGAIAGICQGFYLLSTDIRYTDLAGNSKTNNNNLNLLPGTTQGDIRATSSLAPYNTGTNPRTKTTWYDTFVTDIAINTTIAPNHTPHHLTSFYWGGPTYHPRQHSLTDTLNILGSFSNISPVSQAFAIASRSIGEGQVLGISPHLEVSSTLLRTAPNAALFDHDDGTHRHHLANQLEADDTRRTHTFFSLLDTMLLNTTYGTNALAMPHHKATTLYHRDLTITLGYN